jgi:hypothetical protein
MLLQSLLLFGVVPLASKMRAHVWLWVILSLIPGIGAMMLPVLVARGLAALLGRLPQAD